MGGSPFGQGSGPRPGPPPAPRPTPAPGQPAPGQPAPGQQPTPGPRPAPPAGDAAGIVAGVEESVAGLAELDDLPVGAHVARYDALHTELSEALASIDGV